MTQKEDKRQEFDIDLKYYLPIAKYLIPIAIIVIILVFIIYILVFQGGLSNEQGDWGQFGDYFGGVLNPILGFFTIILLIITLSISYQTLKVSKIELEKATEMLKLARD